MMILFRRRLFLGFLCSKLPLLDKLPNPPSYIPCFSVSIPLLDYLTRNFITLVLAKSLVGTFPTTHDPGLSACSFCGGRTDLTITKHSGNGGKIEK